MLTAMPTAPVASEPLRNILRFMLVTCNSPENLEWITLVSECVDVFNDLVNLFFAEHPVASKRNHDAVRIGNS